MDDKGLGGLAPSKEALPAECDSPEQDFGELSDRGHSVTNRRLRRERAHDCHAPPPLPASGAGYQPVIRVSPWVSEQGKRT